MKEQIKKFDAEVGKVLHLMIHSIYTNKDIFIRELISNASDACDKLRYLSQTDPKLIDGDSNLKIQIHINKDSREMVIQDNGIGMSQMELIENLGTIAKSGTKQFLDNLTGDSKKDSNLIGQFGVGFYSAFMVADNVTVFSRKAGEGKTHKWYSEGNGEYSIAEVDSGEISRGTKIILKIKQDLEDYVDHFRVKHIIKTYSDHINVPIYYIDESANEVQVNSSSAVWTRQKSEITAAQYDEFYKSVSFAADKPWLTMHNRNEGLVEYTNLLFIPSTKTFDLFHPDRKRRVKLYIKKVFISDDNVDLIPHYLRFLRGVVDSEDLPLNISRESLQHNATIDKIRNSITKRVVSELCKKKEEARDEYEIFWKNFGAAFKEGLCEITPNQEQLLEASLFYSCKLGKMISLDEYIASLPEEAKENKTIYYLSAEDPEKLRNSPQVEGFISKDIDVLIFSDPVDDFWVNVATKYKDYEIKSVTRASNFSDSNNKSTSEKKEETKEDIDNKVKLIDFFKSTLGETVKDVIESNKLTSSPACLSVAEGDMDIRMERFLLEQKQLSKATSKILEINLSHPILKAISAELNKEGADLSKAEDMAWLLFDQSCVLEGEPVKDVTDFSKRLTKILQNIL
jgi:molecular chaperone HtpG